MIVAVFVAWLVAQLVAAYRVNAGSRDLLGLEPGLFVAAAGALVATAPLAFLGAKGSSHRKRQYRTYPLLGVLILGAATIHFWVRPRSTSQ